MTRIAAGTLSKRLGVEEGTPLPRTILEYCYKDDALGDPMITDEHIAMFATESSWDELADALITKYGGVAERIVLYNALADADRFERYGVVAQQITGVSLSG